MVNTPLLQNKVVLFIIGIIIGLIILSLFNKNSSFLKCSDTEKFTESPQNELDEKDSLDENDTNPIITNVPVLTNQCEHCEPVQTVQPVVPCGHCDNCIQAQLAEQALQNQQEIPCGHCDNCIKAQQGDESHETLPPHDDVHETQPPRHCRPNVPLGYDYNSNNFGALFMSHENNVQNVVVNPTIKPSQNNIPIPLTNDTDYASFNINENIPQPTMQVVTEPMTVTIPPSVPTDSDSDDKPIQILNFNTSWCGWSKKFQPEWDKFMAIVKSDPKLNSIVDVQDVKCDNDDNKQLCIENKVQGYPTVIIKANGTSSDYEGPRNVDGLLAAINKIKDVNIEHFAHHIKKGIIHDVINVPHFDRQGARLISNRVMKG